LALTVKKAGQELNRDASITDAGRDLITRGITIVKELADPTTVIEDLLTTPRLMLTTSQVEKALIDVGRPFKKLQIFSHELLALHRVHVGQSV